MNHKTNKDALKKLAQICDFGSWCERPATHGTRCSWHNKELWDHPEIGCLDR